MQLKRVRSKHQRRWPRRIAIAGSCGFLTLSPLATVRADPPPAPQDAPDAGPMQDTPPTSADERPEGGLLVNYGSTNPPQNNDNTGSGNTDSTGESMPAPNAPGPDNANNLDSPL